MGLLDRVATLIKANINDLLDRAEDPEKVIKQLILDMNSQLVQVKAQVAAAIADEQKLKRRWEENQAAADEWQRKAELAVDKGEDDLAKQALARRNSYAALADGFRKQYEEQAAQVEQLKDALRQLEAKIEEAEAKKDLLIARSRRARAETHVRETLAGVREVSALSEFERLEEKVEEEELRARAAAELDTDTLESKFEKLEQEADLDRQLRELKEKRAGRG